MNKKQNKQILHKLKCKQCYEELSQTLNLQQYNNIEEQVRILVFNANNVLTSICENADKIKIDLYNDALDIKKITKSQWSRFVKLQIAMDNDSLQYDKVLNRLEEDVNNSINALVTNHTFIKSFINGTGSEFPEISEIPELPNIDKTEQSHDFDKLLNNASEIRSYINNVLWSEFTKYACAAEHVTNGELCYKDFKNLVDWEHYKNGGYPSEHSKPRLWSILDKTDRAVRLMEKYEFPQIKQLYKQFGWKVTFTTPSSSRNSFTESGRILADYIIYKPVDLESLEFIGMLSDEHILQFIYNNKTYFAIYDIETRVIRKITDDKDNKIQYYANLTTKVSETFDYLVLDEITHPLYIKDFQKDSELIKILHPDNIDTPSASKRILSDDEIEFLGEDGYHDKTNIFLKRYE